MDVEPAKLHLEIAKLTQASFLDRRKVEWQLLVAYWTALILVTSAVLTGSVITKGTVLCLLLLGLGIFFFLLLYFCIIPIQQAHAIDKAFFLFHLKTAEGLSTTRPDHVAVPIAIDLRWTIGQALFSGVLSAFAGALIYARSIA